MKVTQSFVDQNLQDWNTLSAEADLVLTFGERTILSKELIDKIKEDCPTAQIIGGSTSGAIYNTNIKKNQIVITTISFDKTKLKTHRTQISNMEQSFKVGEEIGKALSSDDLKMILVNK